MDEPRDGLDDWLSEQVTPLHPPPGTFELIRRRARRRKTARAAMSAAAVAVVAAAAATIPQLPSGPVPGQPAASVRHTRSASEPSSPTASLPNTTPTPARAPTPSGQPPAPPDFAASSVTFVGAKTGWVIGQAGTPGHCATAYCTSVARTDNGGRTWYGVPAPRTGPPDGGTGVSQIRFLNLRDGWAFGPALYATHDGGRTWRRVDTHGLRVTALATRDGVAAAVWARCTGSGTDFAAHCTSFAVYSSPAGSDHWTARTGAVQSPGAGPASASLLLAGGEGYLIAPGHAMAGPPDGSAPWKPLPAFGVDPGPAQPDGQPTGEFPATLGHPNRLVLVCGAAPVCGPGQGPAGAVYTSADGGKSWQLTGQAPVPGTVRSAGGFSPDGIVLATSRGIEVSRDGGRAWRAAEVRSAPPGGFSYVGMTTAAQGVAVPADTGEHAVWFTYDGGRIWRKSPIP